MKIIKIFLASSDELLEDRIAFGDFVRRLDSLYKKRGISIELFKWEDFEAYYTKRRKQDEYNDKIKESDFFLALFHTKAGQFTIEEFNVAKDEYDRNSSPLVYVYCKDLSTEDIESAELAEFKKTLSEKMEHYWGHYNNQDSLQLQFALQLRQVESYGIIEGVNVDNGIVKMDGMPISKMDNLKFAASNEEFAMTQKEIHSLQNKVEQLKFQIEKHPDIEYFKEELQKEIEKLNQVNGKFDKIQKNLFDTALRISQLIGDNMKERTRRAIEAFENGDSKKANIILDEAEFDAKNNLDSYKESREITEQKRKNVIDSIIELQLKCATKMGDVRFPMEERINKVLGYYTQLDEMAYEIDYDFMKHVRLLLDYADFLRVYGFYKHAIEIYCKIEDKIEGKIDTNDILYAYLNNNMAYVFSKTGNYDEALCCLQYALEINQEKLGEHHPRTIMTLNNLGEVYRNIGNLIMALDYFQKAISLGEKFMGNSHKSLATYYNNVGSIYFAQRKFKEANTFYYRAIEILIKFTGENNSTIGIIYNNIGLAYFGQLDTLHAIEYHKKAIEIVTASLGRKHPELVTFYKNLGMDYDLDEDYENACIYYRNALELLHLYSTKMLSEEKDVKQLLERALANLNGISN